MGTCKEDSLLSIPGAAGVRAFFDVDGTETLVTAAGEVVGTVFEELGAFVGSVDGAGVVVAGMDVSGRVAEGVVEAAAETEGWVVEAGGGATLEGDATTLATVDEEEPSVADIPTEADTESDTAKLAVGTVNELAVSSIEGASGVNASELAVAVVVALEYAAGACGNAAANARERVTGVSILNIV